MINEKLLEFIIGGRCSVNLNKELLFVPDEKITPYPISLPPPQIKPNKNYDVFIFERNKKYKIQLQEWKTKTKRKKINQLSELIYEGKHIFFLKRNSKKILVSVLRTGPNKEFLDNPTHRLLWNVSYLKKQRNEPSYATWEYSKPRFIFKPNQIKSLKNMKKHFYKEEAT